jgi:hypothetical protein
MVVIRKEQMDVLNAHMMRKYEERVLARIAKTMPKRYEQDGEEKLRTLIRTAIGKGDKFGITEDDDTEAYIFLILEHGLDFEKPQDKAECRRILEDKELAGDAKVALVTRELRAGQSPRK